MYNRIVFMERLTDVYQTLAVSCPCPFSSFQRSAASMGFPYPMVASPLKHLCFSVWELSLAVLSRSYNPSKQHTPSKELEMVNKSPNSFLGQSWGVSTQCLEGHSGTEHRLPNVLTCSLTYLQWLSPFPVSLSPRPHHASPDYVPPKWLASK